jgi:hypothetical protein
MGENQKNYGRETEQTFGQNGRSGERDGNILGRDKNKKLNEYTYVKIA